MKGDKMKKTDDLGGVIGVPVYPSIKKPYDPSEQVGVDTGPGLTKQADKDACDINLILKRYENDGLLPDMIRNDARYGDFSSPVSFQEALNTVMIAEAQFGALSAKVRAQFDNDPAKMLMFCADPKNAEEMIKLGLAIPRQPVPEPSSVVIEPKTSSVEGKKA